MGCSVPVVAVPPPLIWLAIVQLVGRSVAPTGWALNVLTGALGGWAGALAYAAVRCREVRSQEPSTSRSRPVAGRPRGR